MMKRMLWLLLLLPTLLFSQRNGYIRYDSTHFSGAIEANNIIAQTSIAGLRNQTWALPAMSYQITDAGREGLFRYDAFDVYSADDGAMTIVNGTKRYKRVPTGAINVNWFTGFANIRDVVDGSISASSTTLTSATAKFDASLVGQKVVVNGAGASGAHLVSTIASYISATQITVANAASTTVSNARIVYGGTDETAGWQAATNYMLTSRATGKLNADGRHWIEGTVYINPTVQFPITLQGTMKQPTDNSLGYISGGTTILRTTTGDIFRVNLDSTNTMVYPAPNYWSGFAIDGFSFVNRANGSGITALNIFKVRSNVSNLFGSGLDYLGKEIAADAAANTNYSDMSVWSNIRVQSSKLGGLMFDHADATTLNNYYYENPTATAVFGLEVRSSANFIVNNALHSLGGSATASAGSSFIFIGSSQGVIINSPHIEDQYFQYGINISNCDGVTINGLAEFCGASSHGNTTIRVSNVRGLHINDWYAWVTRANGYYDIDFQGSTNEDVVWDNIKIHDRSGSSTGTPRKLILNNPILRGRISKAIQQDIIANMDSTVDGFRGLRSETGATNLPSGESYFSGFQWNINRDTNYTTQFGSGAGPLWRRSRFAGTWSPWRKVLDEVGSYTTTGNWDFNGSTTFLQNPKLPYSNRSVDFTLGAFEYASSVDASGGNRIVVLPSAATYVGKIFIVSKIDASTNYVRIGTTGADVINSSATYDLATQWQSLTFHSDGIRWKIISRFTPGKIILDATNTTTGTTGAQTINKPSGTVNIAAAGTSVVVTNSLVTTSSIILCVIRTNDANATSIKSVVPAAGSFTINLNNAPAAEISIGFIVFN